MLPSDYKICPDYACTYSELSKTPMSPEMISRLSDQREKIKEGAKLIRRNGDINVAPISLGCYLLFVARTNVPSCDFYR
eukprot:SAG11_NODE_24_length_24699_cov_10.132195_14_plen_79_part_00